VNAEQRLRANGIDLTAPLTRLGRYRPGVRADRLVFLAGQTGTRDGQPVHTGVLGASLDIAAAQESARLAAVNALTALRQVVGDLDAVEQVVRLTVYVNATQDFQEHPRVADAATAVFEIAFGSAGLGARSAVGVHGLPQGAPVELDLIALTSR
jgi:enamine deaminase RidA (YjgF/YER057c/UK114 family)